MIPSDHSTIIQIFENNTLNYILTIVWVVGIMNSINMLDNMDGITSLTSIFHHFDNIVLFKYQFRF